MLAHQTVQILVVQGLDGHHFFGHLRLVRLEEAKAFVVEVVNPLEGVSL